jgi:hypothetical protein
MSGGLAAIAILLVAIAVVVAIGRRRRADSVFAAYAEEHGMTLFSSDRSRMPETTPLLRRGDARYAERLLEGPLAGDPEGLLANYTYAETSSTAEVRRRYTVAYVTVPESVPIVQELFVGPRSGPSALEGIEDALGGPRTRVELESEALSRSHEIFASEMQDPNRIRQLFSPSFVLWLAEEAPPGFGFELVGGKLCCHLDGHAADADRLDSVAAATTTVANRLRDEAKENVSR